MSSRKRKRGRRGSPDYTAGGSASEAPSASEFFVQAHEATIVCGGKGGGDNAGLIRWQGEGESADGVWMDRYDARMLLGTLPDPQAGRVEAGAGSPTGWSDLPSDAEDAFFLSAEEMEDVRREKRRKGMEAGREERLRALRAAEGEGAQAGDERAQWGGDDEEPDAGQRRLMERTAQHLASSANAGQLEMRILANHGGDARFAFLRGRWRNRWMALRLAERERETRPTLVAYGDSDEDSP